MRVARALLNILPALSMATCVPADEALGLGSVEFTFGASERTRIGVPKDALTPDHYSIKFERVLLSFKTMTIGKVGVPDTCAYRGRGATTNVVFNPLEPIVQTFNGIKPIDCPDVGVIFGAPDGATALGPKVRSSDLIDMAQGTPAEAIIEATATNHQLDFNGTRSIEEEQKIRLRFDAVTTSSRFGGCRSATRGVRILANQRELVTVRFAAEAFFRDAISQEANLRVQPYVDADRLAGNDDGVTTMDELDAYPLSRVTYTEFYQMPDGRRAGFSFGDYVRALFRFSIFFRNEEGVCIGNEPGAIETATDAGSP